MKLEGGQLTELAPGVRRLVAPNPSVMTGPGTNTYLLGTDAIAVVDPGPAIGSHIDAIVNAAADAPIRWILVTHTHTDHSPGAALLAAATGAPQYGQPAPVGRHQDDTFAPDHVLADGETFATGEFKLDVLHTPGHASNHLCFLHTGHKWLLTGDHIINGSTVVIDPPDGNMGEYLRALGRLRELDIDAILPGHGDVMNNPHNAIDRLIEHRRKREAMIVAALKQHPDSTSRELVEYVYTDIDEKLHGLAEHSLLAHLMALEEDMRAKMERGRWRLTN